MTIQISVNLPKMAGLKLEDGIVLIGEPTPIPGTNLMRCLANVYGALCLIKVSIKFEEPSS